MLSKLCQFHHSKNQDMEPVKYMDEHVIYKNDVDFDTFVYKGSFNSKSILFVLGKPNYEYKDLYNIIYFNLYAINLNANKTHEYIKIGIYEIYFDINSEYSNILDIETSNFKVDYDNEGMNNILLFSKSINFINNFYNIPSLELLNNSIYNLDKNQSTNPLADSNSLSEPVSEPVLNPETQIETITSSSESNKITIGGVKKIKSGEKIISDKEKFINYEKNHKITTNNWIKFYLKSTYFEIEDNECRENCLFTCLKESLQSTNDEKYKKITVKDIRTNLSKELKDRDFIIRRQLYDNFFSVFNELKELITKNKNIHKVLKLNNNSTSDINKKKEILEKIKKNKDNYVKLQEQIKIIENLLKQTEYIKDIKNLEQFKQSVINNNFPADDGIVSILEYLYNIKFIIFDKDNYILKDHDNILRCNNLHENIKKKLINHKKYPEHYIILEYSHKNINKSDYRLIYYEKIKDTKIKAFEFEELLDDVKNIIVKNCIKYQGINSSFILIPEFKIYCNEKNITINSEDNNLTNNFSNNLDKKIQILIHSNANNKNIANNFFNIYEYGEFIPINKLKQFLALQVNISKYNNWRQKLDNNWIISDNKLKIDGNFWASIQHFLYATRFSNVSDIYKKFIFDINNPISHSVEKAKLFYNKMIKDESVKSKLKESNTYENELHNFLNKALFAKFSIDEYKNILLSTLDSDIYILKPNKKYIKANNLMKIREIITNQK